MLANTRLKGELKIAREELQAAVQNVDSLQRQCDSVSREVRSSCNHANLWCLLAIITALIM